MTSYKIIVLTLLVFALAALVSCGGSVGGGSAPSDPKGLVLEDSHRVQITDVKALLESSAIPASLLNEEDEDPEDFKDDFRDEWEDKSRALATDPDTVTYDVEVSAGVGSYYITKGEFEFGAIKNELEDQGYDDGTYRDQEIWESENGNAVALFEGAGSYVYGSSTTVKEILKANARGEGFMTSEADLRRALDKVDGGALNAAATSGCSGLIPSSLNGCRASAIGVTGGDEDSVEIAGSAVFSSERRAESGMDDIEDGIEDDDSIDADLEEISVDGEIVSFRVTIYK